MRFRHAQHSARSPRLFAARPRFFRLPAGRAESTCGELPITAVEDDLLAFQRYLDRPAGLILCMGDTLTHLPDRDTALKLFTLAAASLRPGGTFAATFRDYTQALVGNGRFIPIKSDADRILTCFLEYASDHVDVHDLLHERNGDAWQLRVSTYQKVRLNPQWVSASLQERGFSVSTEPGAAGMIRVIAIESRRLPGREPRPSSFGIQSILGTKIERLMYTIGARRRT